MLKWSGGLSKEERDIIGRLGFSALKKEVEVETDKPAYCERVSQALQRGILDFDQREYTASALRRIMAFDLD